MMFYSKVEDLDSYKRVINRLITFLIVLGLSISLIAMWFIYSDFEKKANCLNKELLLNANSILQSHISERLSILVNNQDFVSYLNKGEYSRKLNVVDMMVLFKKFIDGNLILGVQVTDKTDDSILSLGSINLAFQISLDLCYLNGQINNKFGNCFDRIIVFVSKKSYLDHLSKINLNIEVCEENKYGCVKFNPFTSNKFGSFTAKSKTTDFISLRYASPNTYQFFIPAIIIFIISALGLFVIHKAIKILTDKHLAEPIKEIETNLKNNRPLKNEYIEEINYLAKEIEEYQQQKVEIELGKNLAQVAHDIRSPLLAVDSFFCLVEKKLAESERIFGRRAIRRLDDIVWSLLYKYKNKNENNHGAREDYVFLHSCIQEILSEKRMEYSKQNIDFEFKVGPNDVFSLAFLNSVNLKRVLSNLINNAVNAILPNNGIVEVSLEANIAGSIISIKDNGRGMTPEFLKEILSTVQSEKIKTNLGLPHAIKFLEQIGGSLELSSDVEDGTKLDFSLPPCEIPVWCLREYPVGSSEKLIIIDDSNSVHDVWDEMFKRLQEVNYQHLYTSEEALKFFESITDENLVIFCDYEFFDEDKNGLDILQQAPVNSVKVLVTSHLYNPTIMNTAIQKGFKVLPKDLVPYFKLHDKKHNDKQTSLIFIDDEPRNTQSWEFFAEAKDLTIITHNDIKEFFANASLYSKDIPIYVDLNLSQEKNGIEYAKEIFELGFQQIYIATGAIDTRLKKAECPWIIDIVEKKFPFI